MRCRPGVPGSQSHTSRSVLSWVGLSGIGDDNVMASGFFGVTSFNGGFCSTFNCKALVKDCFVNCYGERKYLLHV